jgi:hypothetical protein
MSWTYWKLSAKLNPQSETPQEDRKSQADSGKEADFKTGKMSANGPYPRRFGTIGRLTAPVLESPTNEGTRC